MDQFEHNNSDHDAFLRRYLAERDEECPMCSYNLRGLAGQLCPECGEALRLRVSLCEPKMGLYLTGVIGWAIGAGFAGLLLAMYFGISGGYPPELSEIWPLWVQFIGQGSLLGLSLWKGRWIRKRSLVVRRLLAAAAWLISVVLAFSFLAVIT